MQLNMLEHVNIITAHVDQMEEWYISVLGFKKGYRPPFTAYGKWLYIGEIPAVHLVEGNRTPQGNDPRLSHFACRATGLAELLQRLKDRDIFYEIIKVPELRILQIALEDPEGNQMHIDFLPEEADELGL